jgi:hypothetical protein
MSTTKWLPTVLCIAACVTAATVTRADDALADPTQPGSRAASRVHSGGLQVQGIITRSGTRIAIVDGRLVRAGDRVGNVVIQEVLPEGVRYSRRKGHTGFARLAGEISTRRATVADVP